MSETTALFDDSTTNKTEQKKFLLGITGAFGFVFANVGGIACIQLMNQIPPDFQLSTFRFTVGLIFATIYLTIKGKLPKIERKNIKWLIAIAVLGIAYNVLIYNHFLKSITFVGIQSLLRSFNIVFSFILSKIFLKVKISVPKALTAIAVLGGLGLILGAQYVEGNDQQCDTGHDIKNTSSASDVFPFIMEKSTTETSGIDLASGKPNNSDTVSKDSGRQMCFSTMNTIIGTVFISLGALSGCFESITFAGTGIKEENTVVISFWEFVVGIGASLVVTLLFENPIIPDNLTDILLLCGHSVSASSVTYLDLLAVQNIDVNLYYVTITLTLPLSLLLQYTVLHSVNPNANLLMLVSGSILIFLCAISMTIYEYFNILLRK